jgi:F-type H+-transporting ATPase subunit a
MLAEMSILDHVTDHPWAGWSVQLGGMTVTLMSSGIATMILVAAVLIPLLIVLSRRYVATGQTLDAPRPLGAGAIEVLVLFIRDQIAIPSLGQRAYAFLPFLLTLFVFVLAMNLSGLTPLSAVSGWLSDHRYPVGHTPTSILTVCAALAGIAMLTIMGTGLWKAAQKSSLPLPVALPVSPVLWFFALAPHIPGVLGKVLAVPLAVLELIGVVAKCFALMVRLFANMVAGHIMLAVLMIFIVQTLVSTVQTAMDPTVANEIHFFYVGPLCVIGSVLVDLMELLVAGLQAYIYTFLTAMFIGLYAEPSH